MVSHLYWLHSRFLMALKGVRNQRRAMSGRLEDKQDIITVTKRTSVVYHRTFYLLCCFSPLHNFVLFVFCACKISIFSYSLFQPMQSHNINYLSKGWQNMLINHRKWVSEQLKLFAKQKEYTPQDIKSTALVKLIYHWLLCVPNVHGLLLVGPPEWWIVWNRRCPSAYFLFFWC